MNADSHSRPIPPTTDLHIPGLSAEIEETLAEVVTSGPDPGGTMDRMLPILEASAQILDDSATLRRIAAVAGNSKALATALATHPELINEPSPDQSVTLQLRGALVEIAGDDLMGLTDLAVATRRFSDAIDGIVDGELAKARQAVSDRHPAALDLGFAVIAMGKWGARELNYASDIDLMYAYSADGLQAEEARTAGLALASRLTANLSSPTFDGPALVVDANLRPEGMMGPLCRSVEGYERYYEQWGESWERQALLKARFSVGDEDVGSQFMRVAQKVVWETGFDPEALRSIRRIKEQTESEADPRDIKRGRGGIRDVEFAVQLLQIVHGRVDADLRTASTLDAIDALAANGYLESPDRDLLVDAYQFLRALEHRIQLWDLRQTHTVPTSNEHRERLARSMGLTPASVESLEKRIGEVRASVRDVHERLYYRPILDALAGSPTARLGATDATLRLESMGFANTEAAAQALSDLTAGINRRSKLMHQLLPLMLDWLSLSPDPDMGLNQLRTLLAHTPDHSALVSLLQTNPLAGERLCLLLGSGRLLGGLIDRIPEFIPRLADDRRIDDIRDAEGAEARLIGLLDSRPDLDARIGTVRRFIRRRKLRIAARDVLNGAPIGVTMASLSDSGDAAIKGAFHVTGTDNHDDGFAVVAMGKFGGRELSYESDLDLIYIYRAESGRDSAMRTAASFARILAEPSRHGEGYQLDTGLRPEGKSGPLARSLDGYRRYYGQWAQPWEMLALIKARPVGGDADTLHQFFSQIEDVLWPLELPAETVFGIRSIKARVENERIPPGEDPDYHLKLGKGSLSDVEFVTQLLQLQHGGANSDLRSTGTLDALDALAGSGHLSSSEHQALKDAYSFCTRVRMRLHLQTGRVIDSLPTDRRALSTLASSLGFDRSLDLREEYRRVTRRSRVVFERLFY